MAHVPERKYDMSYLFEQVAQLVKKLSKSGWSKSDVTLLGQASAEKLNNVLLYLHGQIDIVRIKHTIDLAKSPRLPFDGADEVVKHDSTINGKNVVEIELRSDDNLYVDRMKIILHLSEGLMSCDRYRGCYELRQELKNGELVLLNNNILDKISDHPEMFPEHWKRDEYGNIRTIIIPVQSLNCMNVYQREWCGESDFKIITRHGWNCWCSVHHIPASNSTLDSVTLT